MNQRNILAAGIVLIVAVGIVATALLLSPPPSSPPDEKADQMMWGDFLIRAEASFAQDFMPIIPEEGPPFFSSVRINVTNTGQSILDFHNFSAITMTIYYNNTSEALVTLSLFLSPSQELPYSVEPGESVILHYSDRDDEIFSPNLEEGTYFYARVSFTWNNMNWYTLTTEPSEIEFTY
ncbi:hypothetical protein EU537_05655 [Candidatus Thorarchaeota archaeon]|nr:MAG: hypothetical protein EU537_05655 [Candidatus Thorarchaeota archaeon]